MSISLTCPCGRFCRIKDAFAGRRIRCPDCGKVLEVPVPDANSDVEQEALALLLADSPDDKPAVRTEQREETSQPSPSREVPQKPVVPTPRQVAARPKAPPQKSGQGPRVVFEEGWFGSLNAGVIGGVLMMIIAVVWFVLGLAAGRIFFYPPLLLVIGLIAVIKGLFGGE
jgi:hypothetical protein